MKGKACTFTFSHYTRTKFPKFLLFLALMGNVHPVFAVSITEFEVQFGISPGTILIQLPSSIEINHAQITTGFDNVEVGGVLYDVDFNIGTLYQVYGEDCGRFGPCTSAPQFWNQNLLAEEAAGKLIDLLGTTHMTTFLKDDVAVLSGWDLLFFSTNLITYGDSFGDDLIGDSLVRRSHAYFHVEGWDSTYGYVFADFTSVSETDLRARLGLPEVPIPATAWLFGLGLLVLVGVARGNKAGKGLSLDSTSTLN